MERTLRKLCGLALGLVLVVAFSIQVCAQKNSPPPSTAPLVLMGAIPLPNVKGRIDHFAFDPTHNRLFVSALGNNTEEIIGIGAQTVVHTISGVPTPQGVAYSPETNKLFVGSDEGKLYVYDGTTFDLITSIEFGDDVDNLRYDAAEKRVYVGYGDEKTGAIGMVDPATNKRIADEQTGSASGVLPTSSLQPKHLCELARLEANRRRQSQHALRYSLAANLRKQFSNGVG